MARPLPRTVKALGLVSLLNDASSEMIYPLLPAFLLRTLGAGPLVLGLIEGVAEAAAGLLKIVSGAWSDRLPRRKPFVTAGYALSAALRPVMALAASPFHVLLLRLGDRVGKGARTAPRDALLADVTPAEQRGRAYGFHRAMDHAGALVGPLLAAGVLALREDLRLVFALAALPAAAAVAALVWGVREPAGPRPPVPGVLSAAAPLPGVFHGYVALVVVFTLGNSSDTFLLLKAQEAGIGLTGLPLLWSLHHLVKSAASTHGGILSDRLGRRATIGLGWSVYAVAYAGLAWATRPSQVVAFFVVYALHHALAEGPESAWVADLAPVESRGRAFGIYHAARGAALLPASLLTGGLWQMYGSKTALVVGAGLSALAAIGLAALRPPPRRLSASGPG